MEDLKVITAGNIINLRLAAGMTQAQLAELLSYSDKSVSKWERAEAVPDAYVLKKMSGIFGVTVDYLLTSHTEWKPDDKKRERSWRSGVVTTIVVAGIWTLALLVFIISWLMEHTLWIVFIYAVPASLITLLVLNSIWEGGKYNYWIIGALVFSLFAAFYFTFLKYHWWQIFLLLIPAEFVVFLSSKVKKKSK